MVEERCFGVAISQKVCTHYVTLPCSAMGCMLGTGVQEARLVPRLQHILTEVCQGADALGRLRLHLEDPSQMLLSVHPHGQCWVPLCSVTRAWFPWPTVSWGEPCCV